MPGNCDFCVNKDSPRVCRDCEDERGSLRHWEAISVDEDTESIAEFLEAPA
ncbi:MAG: hypothetical protein LBC03_05575 [Nitrososphaerota archaeon]|nr:hypothetical protein [Nitrososphaerota archaeon]